jgi:hypothetical protein
MKIKLLALLMLAFMSCGKSNSTDNVSEENEVAENVETPAKETPVKVEKKETTPAKEQPKKEVQEPVTLPVGTILFVRTINDINAKSFNAGDHFFVELDKDITSKGKVVIPEGTTVQMEVLVSENKKRRSSEFGVTVAGFIIDNYLQKVNTETKSIKTKDAASNTLKKAAIGAGVGAVFDGWKGAGKGAAVGGATGLLKPGQSIHFPKGTTGNFQLTEPLTVDWL